MRSRETPAPARSGSGNAAGDLVEMLRLLWPTADLDLVRRSLRHANRPPDARELLVLPSATAPRMLLPTKGSWAGESLRRARRNVSARDVAKTRAVGAFLRCGGARLVGDRVRLASDGREGADIERHLSAVLEQPVTVAVFLGPPRANRKPILQIMDGSGAVVGIAKVGVNPLTRRLVGREAEVLASLTGLLPADVTIPALLHHGEWRDLEIVVQSYLPVDRLGHQVDRRGRLQAMTAVATVHGVHHQRLGASTYAQSLRERLAAMHDDDVTRLTADVLSVLEGDLSAPLPFGSWHGDWTAWNMATDPTGRALIWDWERFADDVPLGFDALHYEFVVAATDPARAHEAGRMLVRNAGRLLRPFDISGAVSAEIALLYLIDLSLRYRGDGQAETGVAGGRAEVWLMPALQDRLAQGRGSEKRGLDD